jgi:hypothetical protein
VTKADGTATATAGDLIATFADASKEHQVVMLAGARGHIHDTAPTWVVASGNSANVAAARTIHVDLFNAAGSGVILKVYALLVIPTLAAVTGVGLTWELIRTSAVGTGGTALTARPLDTANAGLHAGVTARSKPTGGATTNYILQYLNTSSEETVPYASLASILNHLAHTAIPAQPQPLVLREGEGLKVDQTTSSAAGSTNIQVFFTAE